MENRTGEAGYRPDAVWLYSDGAYRWVYELDLNGNRYENNYVLRVVALVFVISWVVFMAISFTIGEGFGGMVFAITTGVCLGAGLLSVGMVRLAQRLAAKSQGGVEAIGYELWEEGIRQVHARGPGRVNEVLEKLSAIASAEGIDPVGPGQFGVTRFGDVRGMRVVEKSDLIDLTLKGNYKCRVYVKKEDAGFVRDYIARRIPGGAK